MSTPLLPRLLRAGGVAITAAVVLGCAARADAACGEYVKILGLADTAHPPDHAPPKTPCHGPNCTGGPRAPAPVPPAPAGPAAAVKALVPAVPADSSDPFAGLFAVHPVGDPVRRPSAIFHPPRQA